jgi:ferredoxin
MALPNVIWPWSIFYSKDQLLRKENKEFLGIFYFPKLNIQINCLGGMCQTCQCTTIYGMFGI